MATPQRTAGAMSRRRALTFTTAVGVAVSALALACADAPSAPDRHIAATGATEILSATALAATSTTVTGLLWTAPVSQASVSATIGASGGSLVTPDGAKLIVPKGAVLSSTTFSITRLPGKLVAYDFQPHGTVFVVPLQFQQPTAGTNFAQIDLSTTVLQGAYFPSNAGLNQSAGTATVSEFEPTTLSTDKGTITFTIPHFSGYMVSTGRF